MLRISTIKNNLDNAPKCSSQSQPVRHIAELMACLSVSLKIHLVEFFDCGILWGFSSTITSPFPSISKAPHRHNIHSRIGEAVMGEVKLIGAWGSSMAWRVEMVLKMKGIEYEYVQEDINNKSPLLLQHNPIHKKVPVFLHNGNAIAESLVIIQYIEETWENGPYVLPKHPYDRAVARFWAKYFDETCLPAIMKACRTAGEEREKAKEEAIELLKFLDDEVKGKKFFGGDTIGFVDIAVSCGAYWCGIILELVGLELITKDKLPNLCKWIDEFVNYSFVKENLPDRDTLTQVFKAIFVGSAAK